MKTKQLLTSNTETHGLEKVGTTKHLGSTWESQISMTLSKKHIPKGAL